MNIFKRIGKRLKHTWKTLIKGPAKTLIDDLEEGYEGYVTTLKEWSPFDCCEEQCKLEMEEQEKQRDHENINHSKDVRLSVVTSLIQNKGLVGQKLLDEASMICNFIELGVKPSTNTGNSSKKSSTSSKSSSKSSTSGGKKSDKG